MVNLQIDMVCQENKNMDKFAESCRPRMAAGPRLAPVSGIRSRHYGNTAPSFALIGREPFGLGIMIIKWVVAGILTLLAATASGQQGVPVFGPPAVVGIEKREVQVPIYQRPVIGYMQETWEPRCSLLPNVIRLRRRWRFVPAGTQRPMLPPSSSSTPIMEGARWKSWKTAR